MTVEWLEEAVKDLQAIGRYIAVDDPAAAYRVLIKIEAAGNYQQRHPHLGRPGRVANTRELVVAGLPFILPYYITHQFVRILAVLHTSRKWPDEFLNVPS